MLKDSLVALADADNRTFLATHRLRFILVLFVNMVNNELVLFNFNLNFDVA